MEGLFKTPEQVRQSQYEAMMSPNISSAMRRGMMTGGGLARAFGGVTEGEAQAKQTQDIAKTIVWDDPASIREGAKRFAELGLTESALMAEQKAVEVEKFSLEKEQTNLSMDSTRLNMSLARTQEERAVAAAGRAEELHTIQVGAQQLALDTATLSYGESKRQVEAEPKLREVLAKVDLSTSNGQKAALAAAASVSPDMYVTMQNLIKEKSAMSLEFEKLAAEANLPPEYSKQMEELYIGNMATIESYRQFETKVEEGTSLLEANPWEGGVGKSVTEVFKDNAAKRDAISEAITYARSIAFPEALQNLPPGPATDKDVEEAKKTIPPEGAGSKEWIAWMDRLNRLKAIGATYKELENAHIAKFGTVIGMDQAAAGAKARKLVDERWDKKSQLPTAEALRGELEGL